MVPPLLPGAAGPRSISSAAFLRASRISSADWKPNPLQRRYKVVILPDHIGVHHPAMARKANFAEVPGTAIGRRARHVLVAIKP